MRYKESSIEISVDDQATCLAPSNGNGMGKLLSVPEKSRSLVLPNGIYTCHVSSSKIELITRV